jgi:hypothetical protein
MAILVTHEGGLMEIRGIDVVKISPPILELDSFTLSNAIKAELKEQHWAAEIFCKRSDCRAKFKYFGMILSHGNWTPGYTEV